MHFVGVVWFARHSKICTNSVARVHCPRTSSSYSNLLFSVSVSVSEALCFSLSLFSEVNPASQFQQKELSVGAEMTPRTMQDTVQWMSDQVE